MILNMAENPDSAAPDGGSVAYADQGAFVAQAALEIWDEIRALGLECHVGELEALGYTVIPPGKVTSPDFVTRVCDKVLDVVERRSGVRPDLAHERQNAEPASAFGEVVYGLIHEDRVFEEVIQLPAVLAMITYLVGINAVLMSANAIVKAPGEESLALHTDITRMPAPYPPHAQIANATLLLTDYSLANGSICFVPGSHRYCRPPLPGEGEAYRIPIEAPAGSLAVWSGHTWHGAFPRSNPGLRLSLTMPFCRPYIKPFETLRESVPDEMLARNPKRFATMMGQDIALSFGTEGPDPRYGIESHMMGRHIYD